MRAVMALSPYSSEGGEPPGDADVVRVARARWGRAGERGLYTRYAALDWNGEIPFRTAGNDEQASSVARAGCWKAGRDQKSPIVVALSRVPR